jgi:ketosteroid isomerase-like protein
MTTKETLETYFKSLELKKDWQSFLADDMTFASFTTPVKRINGRTAYIESTRRFYSMITAMKVKELIIEGERACALTHYDLQPPGGQSFGSDVAEVFEVCAGKITSLNIYFDTAPFPK